MALLAIKILTLGICRGLIHIILSFMNKPIIFALALALASSFSLRAELSPGQLLAKRNVERAMAIMDATWSKGAIVKGDADIAMCDVFDIYADDKSGPSDVWPYTAAIEAHCSILEAMDELEKIDDEETRQFIAQNKYHFLSRLNQLIDNLEWYRGSYSLASYATVSKQVSPYAVPRAGRRGAADVSGILITLPATRRTHSISTITCC